MFEYSLYIDIDKPGGLSCLLDGKTSSQLQTEPMLVQGDCFTLKLFFRRRGVLGAASTPITLAAGSEIVLAGKHIDDLGAVTLLFNATSFAETGSGDDLHYEATLDLNTVELDAKVGTNKDISVRIDVEVEDAGNDMRATYQFDATVRHQVYDGEADPTPGTPAYPHPDLLYTKAEIDARIEWFSEGGVNKVRIKNSDGVTVAVFGE